MEKAKELEKKYIINVLTREGAEIVRMDITEAATAPHPALTTMLRLNDKDYEKLGKPGLGETLIIKIVRGK